MTILTRHDEGGIATLTLNQPDKLNPLSRAMLAALHAALEEIAQDRAVRAVILAATGRAFCAGHDLRELQAAQGDPAALHDLFDRCAAVMQRIQSVPQPVIAQVQGLATAAGCQLVATCDLAVAAEDARFGVNGVNIGLFCSTPMVALTRNIPRKAAFEMLTTGAFLTAPRAEALGLINRAVPAADLASETRALAATIAGKLPSAVAIGKRAFYDQIHLSTAEAYALTGETMVTNMTARDTQEGIAAFLEKRDPDWA